MKIITYRFPGFEAVTATKGNTFEVEGKSISDFGYTKDRTPLILHSADEIPCFFYVKEKILGAAVLDQAKILNEFLAPKTWGPHPRGKTRSANARGLFWTLHHLQPHPDGPRRSD
jgi:hypothetical protein